MQVIDDYINGNLTDAKLRAKRYGFAKLMLVLINEYGKSHEAAMYITSYLKGQGSFQAACDADYRSKTPATQSTTGAHT